MARVGRENLADMEAWLATRGVDAAFERTGQLLVALSDAHLRGIDAALEAARRVGIDDHRLLSRDETRSELDSPLYLGALLQPRNALVDPVRLAEGLRAQAVRDGVRVFEQSPVRALRAGGGRVHVRTEEGALRARRAVLAANAYSHRLRRSLIRRFVPLYDYVLVSEPLTAEQRQRSAGRTGAASSTRARSSTTTASRATAASSSARARRRTTRATASARSTTLRPFTSTPCARASSGTSRGSRACASPSRGEDRSRRRRA
jgi:glycine/D-amino acid oxidase-like deaminating enzyme